MLPHGPSTTPGAPQHKKTGTITTRLFVPKKQRAIKRKGRPQFLPTSASEIDFTLIAVNGVSTSNTNYNFTVQTSNCPVGGVGSATGYLCTVSHSAPAGADQYSVQAWTCVSNGAAPRPSASLHPRMPNCSYGYGYSYNPGDPQILSETLTTVNVPPGGSASAKFTLDPVVGTGGNALIWSGPLANNGTAAPRLVNGVYSCTNAYTSCWDPVLNVAGKPQSSAVALNAYDADGDQIVPASGGGSVSGTPVYLQPNGDVDTITWSCNNPSITWETGGGPYAPGQMTVANGEGNNAGINSPVVVPSPAQTTDFNGNPVTAVGNNGIEINYDGTGYDSLTSSTMSCTADDTLGNSDTYYLGDDLVHPTVYVGNGNATSGSIDLLTSLTSIGAAFGALNGPQSFAIDSSGNLYVGDSSTDTVGVFPYSYTTGSDYVQVVVTPDPYTCGPSCNSSPGWASALAVDNTNGRLFVADGSSNSVIDVFTTGFSPFPIAQFKMPPSGIPSNPYASGQSLAIDEHGDLFVSEGGGTGYIDEFAPPYTSATAYVQRIPYGGAPGYLAYDTANDFLYVADPELNQIARYKIGTYTFSNELIVGQTLDANINQPTALGIVNGKLYAASYFGVPERFPSFPNPGVMLGGSYGGSQPTSITTDGANTVFFGLNYSNAVLAYNAATYTAGSIYTGQGISGPMTLAYFGGQVSGLPTVEHRWLLHRNRKASKQVLPSLYRRP